MKFGGEIIVLNKFYNNTVFLSFVVLTLKVATVSSTCYELFNRWKQFDVLTFFSVVKNMKQLRNINQSESLIGCIDGLKAISG